MKLKCAKCNYRFEKEEIPFRCPYCAKEGAVTMQETAQDILDEAAFI
ncbi:MAG: hypothetical protein KJ601_08035 [Nanoarchaeota archaeon]|nr:hypothetical protein [Nanoarchaeota archaeon]MBU1704454.1 hypothetical protein [Nanoarchaeota archaeon]